VFEFLGAGTVHEFETFEQEGVQDYDVVERAVFELGEPEVRGDLDIVWFGHDGIIAWVRGRAPG